MYFQLKQFSLKQRRCVYFYTCLLFACFTLQWSHTIDMLSRLVIEKFHLYKVSLSSSSTSCTAYPLRSNFEPLLSVTTLSIETIVSNAKLFTTLQLSQLCNQSFNIFAVKKQPEKTKILNFSVYVVFLFILFLQIER